jgi:type I restriction enzyme S subunit
METIFLTEICTPKQWKTISSSNLLESGYPVYGANGIIGHYSGYTHEEQTVLITCRGATCGTINVSEPKSYVNGNAMALDNLSKDYDLNFLKYILIARGLNDVISGSAQPQITRTGLKNVRVPNPPLKTQQRIAGILDNATALRDKTAQLLIEYDLLAQSVFLEMFGDPVINEKGWDKEPLKKLGKTITGNTPSRAVSEYYGNYIEWIKTDNINTPNMLLTKADEYLSKLGLTKARKVAKGAILVTCIAGSRRVIGNVSITDRLVSFNQQINAFEAFNGCPLFWYYQFILAKPYVQNNSTNGMKGIITKGKFEKMMFINPTIALQNEFADKIALIEQQKALAKQELQESEDLFNCLLQQAFKGERV